MKLSRLKRKTAPGVNMTPMIDIVFLLIIFFMAVSQISRTVDWPVRLPDAGPGARTPEAVNITINLDEAGQTIVLGQTLTRRQLGAALDQELQRVGQQVDRLRILVRCDRDCPGQFVNELIRQLNGRGIRQVRVAVQVNPG